MIGDGTEKKNFKSFQVVIQIIIDVHIFEHDCNTISDHKILLATKDDM